jgi:hypothetical protein
MRGVCTRLPRAQEESKRKERAVALQLATAQIEQATERRQQRVSRRQQQLEEQAVIEARAVCMCVCVCVCVCVCMLCGLASCPLAVGLLTGQAQFRAECDAAEEARRRQALDWKATLSEQGRMKEEIGSVKQKLDADDEARCVVRARVCVCVCVCVCSRFQPQPSPLSVLLSLFSSASVLTHMQPPKLRCRQRSPCRAQVRASHLRFASC